MTPTVHSSEHATRPQMRRNIGWFEAPENSLGSLCSRLETETQQIHKISGDMLGRQCQAFFTLFVGCVD